MHIGPYSSTMADFPWAAPVTDVRTLLPDIRPPTPGGAPTLGDVPEPIQQAMGGKLSSPAFMVASLLGSSAGGALVGYVSSNSGRGALTGAAFTGSLAAFSDSVLAYREDRTVPSILFALGGLFGLGFVMLRFGEGMGHRGHGTRGLGQLRQQYKVKWPDGTVRYHMAHSTDQALRIAEHSLGYRPHGRPEIYVEHSRGSGRSYREEWRRLQGARKRK